MTAVSNTTAVPSTLYPSTPSPTAPTTSVDTSNILGAMVQDSVTLSSESGIVAALDGGTSSYSAQDLLNNMLNAGPQNSSSTTTPSGQSTTDPATGSSAAGVYDASGALQSLPGDVNGNWAKVLSASPSLSSVVTQDSFDQGIVGTL